MTDQEKIYRIAEHCGAKWIRLAKQVGEDGERRSLVMPYDPILKMHFSCASADGSEKICQIHALPNYLSDLNAMHEVEKTLSERYPFYDHVLQRIMGGEWAFTSRATAKQRAEAFLKTMEDSFEETED